MQVSAVPRLPYRHTSGCLLPCRNHTYEHRRGGDIRRYAGMSARQQQAVEGAMTSSQHSSPRAPTYNQTT